MILGFRANINNDSHRIFLIRLVNYGVKFIGIPSQKERDHYSFVFDTDTDFRMAQTVRRSMVALNYNDIPMQGTL
jgi:hypothetical protein